MPRILRFRNYGVYVYREVGAPHHAPHGHLKHRGRRIASVFLLTLTIFDAVETVPSELLEELLTHQERLLDAWGELNDVS